MTDKLNQKALVVLSGGQDSITCLGIALATYVEVEAITFYYGQRHSVELSCAETMCKMHHVPQKLIDISFLGDLVTSALTGEGDVSKPHPYKKDLPASFVPNRNALFLTIAHAYAQEIGASTIYTGVCQTDYSGYPDCRDAFIKSLAGTLNMGYQTQIEIETPLMHIDKAATFALADSYGFLEHVIEGSHTCYKGDRSQRYDWGYGCGSCPACELRAKGFEEFKNNRMYERKEKNNG